MKIKINIKYDYSDVKKIVQNKQIYILDTIISICDKNNINYWLDAGTLLGAIRHKGFIPWDDDIDIGLMRQDYNKLLELIPSNLPNDLVLQSRKTDNKYKLPFIKIRDKYSIIESEFNFNGIFIDIFPFDKMPKSNLLKKLQVSLFKGLEAMMIHTDIRKLNIAKKTGIKPKLMRALIIILSKFGSLLGEKSFDFLYNSIKSISKLSNSNEIGDGLTASWAYYKSIRNIEVYQTVKKGNFNNNVYNIPIDYDKYLKTLYGDNYMTPIKSDFLHIETVIFLKNNCTELTQ